MKTHEHGHFNKLKHLFRPRLLLEHVGLSGLYAQQSLNIKAELGVFIKGQVSHSQALVLREIYI